jgi:agmatinase
MNSHAHKSNDFSSSSDINTTFGKVPGQHYSGRIDADVAVLGVPFDMGPGYRPGQSSGPQAIRAASAIYPFRQGGFYDYEDNVIYLSGKTHVVDAGDVDIIPMDTEKSFAKIKVAVTNILKSNALPIILGGDHSITTPSVSAFTDRGPVHVIQFDAHLDFLKERYGMPYCRSTPMRRCSEMNHVSGMTQLGIRGIGSANKSDFEDALAAGSTILSVRQIRQLGLNETLAKIPDGGQFYITIDSDAFDPSIAPGTCVPSHGGFLYYEVTELLQGIAKKGKVVGMDLVELTPANDPSGITAILAVRIILDLIRFVFEEWK